MNLSLPFSFLVLRLLSFSSCPALHQMYLSLQSSAAKLPHHDTVRPTFYSDTMVVSPPNWSASYWHPPRRFPSFLAFPDARSARPSAHRSSAGPARCSPGWLSPSRTAAGILHEKCRPRARDLFPKFIFMCELVGMFAMGVGVLLHSADAGRQRTA